MPASAIALARNARSDVFIRVGAARASFAVGPARSPVRNLREGLGSAILLGGAILLWGANWPVMKIGLGHISPLWFSASRFAVGAACLFTWQVMRRELRLPRRADLPVVASIGLLQMMLFTALGAIAMTHLPAGRSAILSYTTPIWVLPVAVVLFREKISRRQWVGIALAGIGVLVLLNPHAIDWQDSRVVGANGLLIAASAAWAVCILHLRYGRTASSAIQLAPWQMLLAAAVLAPLAYMAEGPFAKVENQLDRFRAEEFWDRVMQEIAELLVERGPLTPIEILPELRTWTVRGAALHKEPLTPGTLKKKMDVRVFHGRYFEPRDEGRYARKVG
jgi:drug/metabolite transporter (DMT)-like permease